MPATVQITRFVWIVAAGLCALTSSEDGDAAEPRRNILFIAVDDLRPELGCYGSPMVKSPNIDRLAASGLQFNRAYCQFALCNPSRASLLTGRRPETIQVFTLARFVRDGNPDVVTLPQFFKERGYESRSYGKIFHAGNGNHDDPISWTVPPWRNANDDEPSDTAPQAAPKKSKKKKASPAEPAPDPHANEKPYSAPDAGDEALVDGQIATKAIQALSELRDKTVLSRGRFHPAPSAVCGPEEVLGCLRSIAPETGIESISSQGCSRFRQQRFIGIATVPGRAERRADLGLRSAKVDSRLLCMRELRGCPSGSRAGGA